jgi:hypothetical protein
VKVRLRPLDEHDCYSRCYGNREGNVRIVKIEPRRPRFETTISGEELRQRFETRMGAREPAG